MTRIHRLRCVYLAMVCACLVAFPQGVFAQAAPDWFRYAQEAPPAVRQLAPIIPLAPYLLSAGAAEVSAAAGLGTVLAGGWIILPVMTVGALVLALVMPTPDPAPLKLDLFPYPPGYFDEVPLLLIFPNGHMEFRDDHGVTQVVDRVLSSPQTPMFDLQGNLGVPLDAEGIPGLAMHEWLVDPNLAGQIMALLRHESERPKNSRSASVDPDADIKNEWHARHGVYLLWSQFDLAEISFIGLPPAMQGKLGKEFVALKVATDLLSDVYRWAPFNQEVVGRAVENVNQELAKLWKAAERLPKVFSEHREFVDRLRHFESQLQLFPPSRPDAQTFLQTAYNYFFYRAQLMASLLLWSATAADRQVREDIWALLKEISAVFHEMTLQQARPREAFPHVYSDWVPELLEATEKGLELVPSHYPNIRRILSAYHEFLEGYLR